MSTIAGARPKFTPFQWSDNRLAGLVLDVTSGIKTVMEMLEQDDLESNLLSHYHTGALFRFAIASADMLRAEAERVIAKEAA